MTINLPYSSKFIKVSVTKAKGISKTKVKRLGEVRVYLTLGTRGRGGRGLGRFHEVLEFHIDSENRLLAGFDMKQDGGLVRTYAALLKLIFLSETEEAL